MGRKAKFTAEQKLWAVNEFLSGNQSAREIAAKLGMKHDKGITIRKWALHFQNNGACIFVEKPNNRSYTKSFKNQVVQEYLQGNIGQEQLAAKYNIPSKSTIASWVSKYNNRVENKDYCPKPEVYMAPNRKTTLEERIEIAKWCLEHNKNYKEASSLFNCSYSQVYSWTQKMESGGEEALKDGRGRKKAEEELSKDEKNARKTAILEARIKRLEMENELLKKAEEWERRAIETW